MEDIFIAVREGHEEEVIRLLDADPVLLEGEDHDGDGPLAAAAWYGQLGVVTLLIARGANINAPGIFGRTALHCAAEQDNEEVVALLLENGADTNSRDSPDGLTPLTRACACGHLGVVKMLVHHMGGQGLGKEEELWTALHWAAYWDREEVARFLLLAGIDTTSDGGGGGTARELAESKYRSHGTWEIDEGRTRCVRVFEVRLLTC
jgi:ankyrin repeat protein